MYRSLYPLVLKPGFLTIEYLKGRRASYVQPFKLFLVITLLYFISISIDKPRILEKDTLPTPREITTTDGDTIVTPSTLTNMRITYRGGEISFEPIDTIRKKVKRFGLNVYVLYKYPDVGSFYRFMIKKMIRMSLSTDTITETMRHNASKMIFILIPLSAFIFRLIYMRRKKYFYDHLIFSIHFHSFVFLLFLFFEMAAILYEVPLYIQLLGILIYLYLALKKVFMQSWLRTFVNFVVILLAYLLVALPLFFILLTWVSVTTY